MKILQVVPVFTDTFGGPVSVVRSISKELAKRHEVTVYTTSALDRRRDFENKPSEDYMDGFRVVYFPRILTFTGFNISPTMKRELEKTVSEFDVIHLHSWRNFQDIIVHYYAKKYGVPYVLQTHGSLPRIITKQRLKWVYDESFGHRLLKYAAKVIALSRVEAEQYKRMGVRDEKIAIIPNCIDLFDYAVLPPRSRFKKKFGIVDDKKIILYLGRIHRTKGIDLLVRAYAYLIYEMKYNNTVLVIAGPDDGYLNEAKVLANSLGVYSSTIFTGFISNEDKLGALVDADVFVTPSFYGFPITFLESCISGTPIVTTSLGDSLDWINGYSGYVVPPHPKDIAQAINLLISNNALYEKISHNCRHIVSNCFSTNTIVNKIENIYNHIVSDGVY